MTRYPYDENVPQSLKSVQDWFGKVIQCRNPDLEESNRLVEGGKMEAIDGIKIYHEQYWLKQSTFLKDAFPTLYKRLNDRFDELITYPFLDMNPANSWSLYQLGDGLVEWMAGKFDPLLIHTAEIDRAFKKAFIAEEYPRLTSIDEDNPFVLQPFVHLFHFPHILLPYSEIPEEGDFYLVIFRQHDLKWKRIDEEGYRLLAALKEAKTLDRLFDEVEIKDPQNISAYFQLFIFHNWITCLPEMPLS